jgi:hypothetical protein
MRETLDPVEIWRNGGCFKASPLNWYLQISKFIILMKLIKQQVTLQPL